MKTTEKDIRGNIIVIGIIIIFFLGLIASLIFFFPKSRSFIKGPTSKNKTETKKELSKEEVQKLCGGIAECFNTGAVMSEREEVCSFAENEEMQKNCLDNFNGSMAFKHNKIENCEKISNEEKKNSCKDVVFEDQARKLLLSASMEQLEGVKELCSQISNQEKQQDCLNNYNYQKAERTAIKDRDLEKGKAICEEIKNNPELLATCHENLKFRI